MELRAQEPGAPPEGPAPLGAQILLVGGDGAVPRQLSVQLNQAVFEPREVGTAPAGFELALDPAVEGTLTVAAVDQLLFEPKRPLRPDTHYAATLQWLQSDEPAVGPWRRSWKTPAFALTRTTLRRLGPPGGQVEVDLVFSGAVDAKSAEGMVQATLGDRVLGVRIEPGDEPNVLTASISRPGSAATELELKLKGESVRWAHDAKLSAPGVVRRVPLVEGPAFDILHASLHEGQDGWYVEVICDDNASDGEKRWRSDYRWGNGFEVSPRCELDEDFARAMVHADPATELSFAPGSAGFRVFGKFPRGALRLSLDAGARTVDGGVLTSAWSRDFEVPARSARAAFAEQGRFLPRSAWKNLAVRHLNVPSLQVEVRHVPRENLLFWLGGDEPMTERTSNRVASTHIAVPSTPDQEITSFLSVSSLVQDPRPGVYEVKIDASGKPGTSARVLLTDMHLVAKGDAPRPGQSWSPRITVWALDVHTGEPLSGVNVEALRASGQSMASCTTRGDAGCALTLPPDPVDDSPPLALVASRGEDMTYIELSELELDLPEEVGGEPFVATAAYRAPLWTDRGVYRPGDVAHVAALVRDESFLAPPAELPVVLRLFDPKERESRKKVAATNEVGMLAADFRFGDYASTGRYRVVAEVGGLVVGETTFQVEEFVPERLAVTARTGSGYALETEVPVEISARWLFGGSAQGAGVEVACRVQPSPFAPEAFSGWSFGPAYLSGLPQPSTLGTVNGALDEAGKAELLCPPAGAGLVRGPSELVADAAVFEGDTGRTTVAQARARLHPERYYLGLATSADKARSGNVMPFQGAVVGWSGAATTKGPRQVSVETFRMEEEYGWYYDETDGTQGSRRQLRPVREQKFTVPVVEGRFTFQVTPEAESAGTLVRVRSGGAVTEHFVEGTGTRYWWDESAPAAVVDATPRPLRPTAMRVEVTGPIAVGAQVPVSVTAPYPGRVLFTVETDEVLISEWRPATVGQNSWSFQLDRFVPNVYVSAFLVKDPHLESHDAFLPDRAFGVSSVKVEPAAFSRALTLQVPAETKPYRPLTVGVQLSGSGPAYVTVAAVDEGILSLTKFKDPDPLGVLFAQRALGVSSYETVGWTRMVAGGGPGSSTGGDEEEEEGTGGQGTRVQMVKPVALWSGLVALDENGHADIPLEVPGYRGKLRVMAVAATKDGIGQASAPVVVRDPLVLMTTLPRFLLAGDTAEIPVRVSNLTGAAREVVVQVEATELQRGATPDLAAGPPPPPPLTFVGADQGTLSLPAGETGTAMFRVRASPRPGAVHLKVTATAGKFYSKEELDIPIQLARSEVRSVEHLLVTGSEVDVKPALAGWAEGTDKSTLWLSANPYAESLTHLRYLVDYPFG